MKIANEYHIQQANENGIAHIVIRETLGAVAHFACGGLRMANSAEVAMVREIERLRAAIAY